MLEYRSGDCPDRQVVVAGPRHKGYARYSACFQMDRPSQAEDRIENRAGRAGKRRPRVKYRGIFCRTAASKEFEPISLILDRLADLLTR